MLNTVYTLLAKDYTPVLHDGDPEFAGVFYWNDGEEYKEYTVDQNAFTSFTEALYAGGTVYGFSGSYTANNVVNNYGATLTSDTLTIAWNAENNRFEATATPTGEPTTLTIKTKLTNNANTDFIVGSGVSISGSNNNPAAIANNGTFIVNTNSVVTATFTGNGTIKLNSSLGDGSQILGTTNDITVETADIELGEDTVVSGGALTVSKNLDLYDNAKLSVASANVSGRIWAFGDNEIDITTKSGSGIVSVRTGASLHDSTINTIVYFANNTTVYGENDIASVSVKGRRPVPIPSLLAAGMTAQSLPPPRLIPERPREPSPMLQISPSRMRMLKSLLMAPVFSVLRARALFLLRMPLLRLILLTSPAQCPLMVTAP